MFYPYIMTSCSVTNPLTLSCHESVNEIAGLMAYSDGFSLATCLDSDR